MNQKDIEMTTKLFDQDWYSKQKIQVSVAQCNNCKKTKIVYVVRDGLIYYDANGKMVEDKTMTLHICRKCIDTVH